MFNISDIQEKPEMAAQFVGALNRLLPLSLSEVFSAARGLCPDLPNATRHTFKEKDKGHIGKLVEYHLFGKSPNNVQAPDIMLGDVKVTHVKQVRGGFNAKERISVTNVGASSDYDTFKHILNTAELKETQYYAKIQKGVLIVLEADVSNPTLEQILNERVIAIFNYDLEDIPVEMRDAVTTDYEKIRTCIREKNVSQKGQLFLHIHPHGSKGSKTRALGFTPKFVTSLICHHTGRELKKSGPSWFF